MKVGWVTPGFSNSEQDWCIPALLHLAREMASRCELHIFTLHYPPRRASYGVFGAKVHSMGGQQPSVPKRTHLWARFLQAVWREHRRGAFSVLHGFWGNESGFLTCLAARACHVPSVVSLCGGELVGFRDIDYGMQLFPTQRWLVNRSLKMANTITVGSNYMVSLCRKIAPWVEARRLWRIPLGVDEKLFRPVRERTDHSTLLAVGSLIPVKAHNLLLEAMGELARESPRANLQIVGEGPLRLRLEQRIASLNLQSRVALLGARPHPDLASVYSSADLFVLSSRHEAQAMAVLEAAACGLPIVGTAVGSVVDLAPNAAVAVSAHKAHSLAEGVLHLLKDHDRRAELSLEVRKKAESDYSLEHSTRHFVGLYERLASR